MPRFSTSEKAIIRDRLLENGEQLFIQHGIKKVTIEDITKATGIAAGSFYAFFDSKESLYLEININTQNRIFSLLADELIAHKQLPPKELFRYIVKNLISQFCNESILTMLNAETWNQLTRKVSPELFQKHLGQDVHMVSLITQYGIILRYSPQQTARTMQAMLIIAKEALNLPEYSDVIDIIIEGAVNQLILD